MEDTCLNDKGPIGPTGPVSSGNTGPTGPVSSGSKDPTAPEDEKKSREGTPCEFICIMISFALIILLYTLLGVFLIAYSGDYDSSTNLPYSKYHSKIIDKYIVRFGLDKIDDEENQHLFITMNMERTRERIKQAFRLKYNKTYHNPFRMRDNSYIGDQQLKDLLWWAISDFYWLYENTTQTYIDAHKDINTIYKILWNSSVRLLNTSYRTTWDRYPDWQLQFIASVLCDATIGLHPLNLISGNRWGYKQWSFPKERNYVDLDNQNYLKEIYQLLVKAGKHEGDKVEEDKALLLLSASQHDISSDVFKYDL
jgi:hypothetical protein